MLIGRSVFSGVLSTHLESAVSHPHPRLHAAQSALNLQRCGALSLPAVRRMVAQRAGAMHPDEYAHAEASPYPLDPPDLDTWRGRSQLRTQMTSALPHPGNALNFVYGGSDQPSVAVL